MGLRERRRKAQIRRVLNWPLMTDMMLTGFELQQAEEAGVPPGEEMARACSVRDAVLEMIGKDAFENAVIDAVYQVELAGDDPNDTDAIFEIASRTSGYLNARSRLPHVSQY